jgi:hypothetical protein
MRFSLASTLVVSLAAQATANSWFGKTGAYSEVSLSCVFSLRGCFEPCHMRHQPNGAFAFTLDIS